jgi:adenylate cyclase
VRVRYLGREFLLNDAKKELTMGRAEENDIVIKGPLISRLHAKIEWSRDKFLLVDQSTNGSFVTSDEGKEAFVRRDSVILQGRGLIGLGKLPDASAPDAIRYQLDE